MAGNGTIGLEILEDLPDVDAVVIPYGGGGLTTGIASALQARGAADADLHRRAGDRRGAARRARAPASRSTSTTRPSFVDGSGSRRVLDDDVAAAAAADRRRARRCRSPRRPAAVRMLARAAARDRRGRRRARDRGGAGGPRPAAARRRDRLRRQHRLRRRSRASSTGEPTTVSASDQHARDAPRGLRRRPVLRRRPARRPAATTSATCAPTSCSRCRRPPSERVHRDELLFQTVHQSSELWLKLASTEVEEPRRLIDATMLEAAMAVAPGR